MKKIKINYDFIPSSKVIRYKINPESSDVLATLIYKYKYWKSKAKLYTYKGQYGFHITIDEICQETCLGKSVVLKCIKKLKAEGLIETKRRGLNMPNHYKVDVSIIESYINKYEPEYNTWVEEFRVKNTPVVNIGNDEFETSGSVNSNDQELNFSQTTKNKITKNNITKNNTNHKNVAEYSEVIEEDYWYNKSEELEHLIEEHKDPCYDEDMELGVKEISKYLLLLVPQFKNFTLSDQDKVMVASLLEYKLYSYKIADKIIENAKKILNKSYDCRFGSLFVGLEAFNNNVDNKYS